jgi:hypothetical protein
MRDPAARPSRRNLRNPVLKYLHDPSPVAAAESRNATRHALRKSEGGPFPLPRSGGGPGRGPAGADLFQDEPPPLQLSPAGRSRLAPTSPDTRERGRIAGFIDGGLTFIGIYAQMRRPVPPGDLATTLRVAPGAKDRFPFGKSPRRSSFITAAGTGAKPEIAGVMSRDFRGPSHAVPARLPRATGGGGRETRDHRSRPRSTQGPGSPRASPSQRRIETVSPPGAS